MPDRVATCSVCWRGFRVDSAGRLRVHGPETDRCPGSRAQVMARIASPPTRRAPCPDCARDVAITRQGRLVPHGGTRGQCPGSLRLYWQKEDKSA